MKRWYWLLALALPIVVLSGCTSNSKYQLALDENAALTSQVADLQSQLATAQSQYTQIAKLYPPHDFATVAELTAWLAKDQTNTLAPAVTIEETYSRGLAMQLAALKDGFIISIDQEFVTDDFFFIFGIAVIGGDLWLWDIETDETYQPIGWGKVSRA